jgi:NADH dehydrogenase
MKRIIVAGAGFAGFAALKHLGRFTGTSPEYEVVVFDRNDYTTIIPSLPDVASRRMDQDLPKANIRRLLPRGAVFVNDEVRKADLDARTVSTGSNEYEYDYLLLAAGSVTNLFGFKQHLDPVHVLDSLPEAVRLREAFGGYLSSGAAHTLLVSGAGYTGVEIACFLSEHAIANSKNMKVILVEKADKAVGNLPEPERRYVESLATDLGFEIVTNSSVVSFDGADVTLETGEAFRNVFFIWASGSKRAIEDISGGFGSLPDGRMHVNRFLQVSGYENVFAAGDCAAIKNGDIYLRRAVPFSVASGATAGKNIVRSLENRPLKKYRPVDLGWVIPVYPSSAGKVLGIPVRGRLGLAFHYLTCGYRTHDLRSARGYLALGLKNIFGAR